MLGYGEVQPEGETGWGKSDGKSVLWNKIQDGFDIQIVNDNGLDLLIGRDGTPLLAVLIEKREDVLPALKSFLKKDRWTK